MLLNPALKPIGGKNAKKQGGRGEELNSTRVTHYKDGAGGDAPEWENAL